jgi:hypothetical protein
MGQSRTSHRQSAGARVGNLQALEKLCISTPNYHDEDEDEDDDEDDDEEKEDEYLPTLDWGILAQILSQVRQKIEVSITGVQAWDTEESILFARAIYGHPKITTFEDYRGIFPYEFLDTLYSALASLPRSGIDYSTTNNARI